ncbi:MAG: hypothetical protein LC790_11845 [Actinobacteria bacterium]|nr:hypothetical protein [Actinomycetota bacterium]
MLRKVLAVAGASAASVLVLACPAWAGSYAVSACSPSSSAGLWAQTNTFPAGFAIGNLCGGPAIGPLDGANQGALYAEDILNSPAHIPDGARAGWTFAAPPGTTISAISYYRTLAAYNDQDLVAGLFQADGSALEQCKIPWPFLPGDSNVCSKPSNQAPYTFTGLNTSSLFLGVTCRIVTNATACIGNGTIHAVRAALYSAKVTLVESAPPTLSNLGGALWGGGVVSGVVPVTFAASDQTGIQQQLVRSDAGQTLGSALAPCDFTLAQPCPQQPTGSLSVDTRRVPDGPHTFSVVVTDAATNSQVATSPTVIVHNNRPAAASTPTGQGAPTTSTSKNNTAAKRTKISAVIRGRRLRVSAKLARSGRVRVSWRSKLHGRTVAHGSRMVSTHKHKLAVTFTLSRRARRASTRVAIRSGRRIVAHTRARRA